MIYFLAAVALWLIVPRLWRRWSAWRSQSEAERSFTVRFGAFAAVLAVVVAIAMLYLPHKERVLLLLPIFAVGASLAKWRHDSRERLRRQAAEDENFARARRIN